MKQLILIALLASTATLGAQGIDFFHGTWQEALAKAAAEDKLIFVDAYAQWCGPCKRMAAEVFPKAEVGTYFNRNFVAMKIDMEAPENTDFRTKYPVDAYPTLFFINANGEVVHRVKGAQNPQQLVDLGVKALGMSEPAEDYATAYNEGNRDPDLMYKYVRSLVRNNEPHLKVANDYIRTQSDLTTPANLDFILMAATEADSRLFELLVQHRQQIAAQHSEEMFLAQVQTACENTADKALEYSSEDLLNTAIQAMKQNHSATEAEKFRIKYSLKYAEVHRDGKRYASILPDYAKVIIPTDSEALNSLALDAIDAFGTDQRVLKAAQEVAEMAVANDTRNYFRFHYTLAVVLHKQGKNQEAIAAARRALDIAKENTPNAVSMLESFIRKIEEEG